ARAPYVGVPADLAARDLLGRHEAERAGGVRFLEIRPRDRDPEISEADAGLRRAEHVRRLEIAMHDSGLVRGAEPEQHLAHDMTHEPERKPDAERGATSSVELREIEPVDVLLDEVRSARLAGEPGIERAHDPRARDARHELRLVEDGSGGRLAALLAERATERLHDDRRRQRAVLREPDLAHSAFAEEAPDVVA